MSHELIDLLKIERALLGILSIGELNPGERRVYSKEKPRFEVGRMAELVAQGYYAHLAAIAVARSEGAGELLKDIRLNRPIPLEVVLRKDGTTHFFDSRHFLGLLDESAIVDEMAAVWLVGALLKVGDALSVNEYFDHGPDLELLYHLRNGVAHGNRFNIRKRGKERLAQWPANNKKCAIRSTIIDFEISEQLNGKQVLFEFMGPGDVLDSLMSIGVRFMRLRERIT